MMTGGPPLDQEEEDISRVSEEDGWGTKMQRIGKVENFKGTDQDFEEWDFASENYFSSMSDRHKDWENAMLN